MRWGKSGGAAALTLEAALAALQLTRAAVWLGQPQVAVLGSGRGCVWGLLLAPAHRALPK